MVARSQEVAVDANPVVVTKPLTTVGGLERYVLELARTIDAPVHTPTFDLPASQVPDDVEIHSFEATDLVGRTLQRAAGAIVDAVRYEQYPVPSEYDVVVTVGEPAKALVHRPEQRRIHLLNMPPRWLYDHGPGRYDDAWEPLRWGKRLYQSAVRVHDVSTMARLGEVVVPSETIGRRMGTYYDRTPDEVIYPPVDTGSYHSDGDEGFLLYLGRLAPMKRVDEIVAALSGTDHRLVVAGDGPERDALERRAGPNVDLLGYVSEERKRELLAHCTGLVFNSDREAFGIVPIEAFASGKPVVGVAEGYTTHQIVDGENGVLFERGAENLRAAVEELQRRDWDSETIRATAEQYDVARFRKRWRTLLSGGDADG